MKYIYVNLRNLEQLLLGTLDNFFLEPPKSGNVRTKKVDSSYDTVI